MSDEEVSWRGVSLDEVYDGFEVFEERQQAPDLATDENHTILFEFPLNETDSSIKPIPVDGTYVWDDDHVKLPNSPESVFYEIGDDGNRVAKLRWDLIKSFLTASKICNSHELEKCIKAYNTKFEDSWKFSSLHALFEDEFLEDEAEYFFESVLPKIIEIALKLPELIKCPIPLLKQTMNHSVSMSKEQVACLLANAFLCTFPNRNGPKKNTDLPEINFNRLFCCLGSSTVQKIKCICNYFRRVLVCSMPDRVITYQRRYIAPENFPKWEESELKFSSVNWVIDSFGRIENGHGMLQMDFANRYLGGGALGHGCVQEEIRFMINVELIVGMLLCESMKSREAILIYGTEQYNKYSGYSGSFKWEGNFVDETPCDKYRRKKIYIVAVDALPFRNPYMQFEEKLIRRDLNKAYCGFYHDPSIPYRGVPVSGGFWGCGAFGGYNKLKCLIELMACVANRRNLVFYTFGNEELVDEIHSMFTFLSENDISIGQLWSYLAVFKSQNKKFDEFYQFIYDQHTLATSLKEYYIRTQENLQEHENCSSFVSQEESFSSTQHEDEEFDENPSKRTKIDDGSEFLHNFHDNDEDKSDIGSEVEIMDRSDNEEDLEEIVVVGNEDESHKIADIEEKSSEEQEMRINEDDAVQNDDQNMESEVKEVKPTQKNTILNYFKPKSANPS